MALTKINTNLIANNTIALTNIADNAIDATKIANNQILARHIAAGSISDQLAAAQPTITSLGTLTTLTVDDITINSSTISDAGDLSFDVGADITLDAGGGDIILSDDGTIVGTFSLNNNSGDFYIRSRVSNKDMLFRGNDGGSEITALTLDMSNAGYAYFNRGIDIQAADEKRLRFTDADGTFRGGIQAVEGGGQMIATTAQHDIAIRSQSNMLFSSGGNTERMRITSAGDVQIGTASGAGGTLTIEDNSKTVLISPNSSDTIYYDQANLGIRANTLVNLMPGGNTRLSVADGGTTVTGTLDVSGNISGDRLILDGTGSATTRYIFTDNTNTGTGRLAIQSGGGSAGYGGGLSLYSHSHASKPGWVTAGISSGAGSAGTSTEGRFTVNTQGLAGGTDIFTVLNSGKVGIGTTSPATTLHMDASGGAVLRMQRISSNASNKLELSFDGSNGTIQSTGEMKLMQGGGIIRIYADSTQVAGLATASNNLTIKTFVDDKDILFNGYTGGSVFTALTLDMSDAGTAYFNSDIRIPDSKYIRLGGSSDLLIYHDTNHSYIEDDGTGDLRLKGSTVRLQGTGGTNLLVGTTSGATTLYHNNSAKLATSSTGVSVTGAINGSSTLSLGGTTSRTLGAVTGEYGTLQVSGSGAGGYEGLAIDGRVVLMHDGGSIMGIYNDVDNEWLLRADLNGSSLFYYNGLEKLKTVTGGIDVTGNLTVPDANTIYGGNIYIAGRMGHKDDQYTYLDWSANTMDLAANVIKLKGGSVTGLQELYFNNGQMTLADDASYTISGCRNTGVLIIVGSSKSQTGTTYDTAMFFGDYGNQELVEVADPSGKFSVGTGTDGVVNVGNSGNSGVVITNKVGNSSNFSIAVIRTQGL